MSAAPDSELQTRAGLLYIDGEEVPSQSGATYSVTNPATGAYVGHVADAGPGDVDLAVLAAQRSFDKGSWSSLSASRRGEILGAVADALLEQMTELATVESLCSGKPIRDCLAEVRGSARYFRYYAAAASHLTGQTIPVGAAGLDLTLREPIGVCALIVPWNGPLAIAAKKVAPALAAGNSVVVKPAPPTPLTAIALASIAVAAGVPPGVVNVITGAGPGAGRQLVAHPSVRKISFTGSTATGRDVLRVAAEGIKRVNLELGGKSPNVVFADSDVAKAAASAVTAVFANCGQDCCARSRVIVERAVFEDFLERLTAGTASLRQGDPLDPKIELGSLISAAHRDRVLGFLDRAASEGASVVCGGDVVRVPGLEAGNAISPAVVIGAQPGSELASEEIFGPVATVLPFDSEDEAVALANGTGYGLSGSVWTRDVGRALRVARQIRSGLLSINSDGSSYLQAPFGGMGLSGFGKEQGMDGLEEFTELRNIFMSET